MCAAVASTEEGGRKERQGVERSDNCNGGTMGNSAAFPPPARN